MSDYVLHHGNKNYSSWSMRAWLALKLSGAPFEAVAFHLGETGVREKIRRVSPTGRVPALHDGELVIWDSLAIAEYLTERHPDAGLWPLDPAARAVARSVVAEMHSGFAELRRRMPFNVRRSSPGKGREPGVDQDIARVVRIWGDCRGRFGAEGPFLFGAWCLGDVFYAPVISRFRTYEVALGGPAAEYSDAVWEQPDVREWRAGAEAESWVESEYDL